MFANTFRIVCLCLVLQTISFSQTEGMANIKGSRYIPLYGRDSTVIKVQDFQLDIYPVTNQQFLEFLKENPKWQKSNVLKLFADDNYLRQFESDTVLKKNVNLKSPVTNVSWFAAKAYCECQGKRLPTIDEWEYVAMADEVTADARIKPSYNQKILSWYETPRTDEKIIGNTPKNYWGVYDMHGLVWEWTLDFNSVLISGESRKDVDKDSNLFCGSAAIGATDLMNYAAFMRYAFRGSIKARFSIKNLGFRCAKDREANP